jgi:hypothetical protein
MKQEYFDCECSDFNHVFRFVYDDLDGDVWVEVQLRPWQAWYKRLWMAIRYLFGRSPAYGFYDTTMLRDEDFPRFHALLDTAEAKRRSLRSSQKNLDT